MAKIYRKIDIHAPVEKVYRYLDDPENLHSWMQNVVVVKNVRGTGESTRYTVLENMAGVPVRGEFEVIEDLPDGFEIKPFMHEELLSDSSESD